ncbi:hypothetical protein IWQ55_006528 [Labrenzia sp. EL_208]|nr:hypothetical protein [Labrenzia sp. EL_132]MBG6233288.1 hypothetical protein [Labrenzia sp. EL_208]
MKMKIKNRLLSGNLVVTELSAIQPDCRRWLAIYPITIDTLSQEPYLTREIKGKASSITKKNLGFRIIIFDIECEYIVNGWDVSEAEMINRSSVIVIGLDSLKRELGQIAVDCNKLTEPWKTEYPL